MVSSGVSNALVKTDKINNLPQNICDGFDTGDTVIEVKQDGSERLFKVANKTADKFSLVYADDENVIIVKYEKSENGWAKVSSHSTEIGVLANQSGSTENNMYNLKIGNSLFNVATPVLNANNEVDKIKMGSTYYPIYQKTNASLTFFDIQYQISGTEWGLASGLIFGTPYSLYLSIKDIAEQIANENLIPIDPITDMDSLNVALNVIFQAVYSHSQSMAYELAGSLCNFWYGGILKTSNEELSLIKSGNANTSPFYYDSVQEKFINISAKLEEVGVTSFGLAIEGM